MSKNKSYFITCSELVTYEITVDAINEGEAIDKANIKLSNNPSKYSLGGDGFQYDRVMEL